jgi:hypothetical protein
MCYRYYSKVDWYDVVTDTHKWFNPKPLTWGDEETWLSKVREGVNVWFTKYWSIPSHVKWYDFDDYVNSLDWVTAGSTDLQVGSYVNQLGVNVPVLKNKSSSAVTHDLDKLMAKKSYQVNKVTIKPDEAPNKTRVIVSSDTKSHIYMSYLSQWLTNGYSPDVCPVYKSGRELSSFWLKYMSEVGKRRWSLPLDQSKFDHHVDRNMLKIFFTAVKNVCASIGPMQAQAAGDLYEHIFDERAKWVLKMPEEEVNDNIVRYCLDNALLLTRDRGIVRIEGKWRGGVASGWRWTIDVDTIMNFAEWYAINALTNNFSNIAWNIFQGDDLAPIVLNLDAVFVILAGYKYAGLEINVKKFFISQIRSEFLRRVVTVNGVKGYPARSIHSLLWNAPSGAKRDEVSPWSRLDLWLIMLRRGCNMLKVKAYALDDISGAFGLAQKDIFKWLSTPISVGGGGAQDIFGISNEWVRIINVEDVNKVVLRPTSKVRGLNGVIINFGLSPNEIEKVVNAMVQPRERDKQKWACEQVPTKRIENVLRYQNAPKCFWLSIPNCVKPVCIERMMDNRAVAASYLTVESATFFFDAYNRVSKRLLREWLQTDMLAKTPKMLLWSDDFLTGVFIDERAKLRNVLMIRKAGMDTLEACALFLELRILHSKKVEYELAQASLSTIACVGN